MLQLALEERQNAGKANNGDKYDHLVLTTQYIPTIELYMLYKSIFTRLIEIDKVTFFLVMSCLNKRSFLMLLNNLRLIIMK